MKVPEALEQLTQEEEQKLIDMDSVARTAVERVEQAGIIFVDEIDKIAGREGGQGPDVSREGVQRDILPIVEGTTVNTKYGMVRTDHILFIAAGAFHVSKPSDLIPELQGRFPIRVELESLGRDDFVRILTEPQNALVKQYIALLDTEGIALDLHRGRHRSHRDAADGGERQDGEHRGPPPAHGDGEAAGRDLVRGARTSRTNRLRSTTRTSAGCWTRSSATKTCHATSCDPLVLPVIAARMRRRVVPCALAILACVTLPLAGACGKKGPPLAPLARVPVAPAQVSASRAADTVTISFTVPGANVSGIKPADIERVDVYAWTGPDAPAARVFKVGKVVASVPVRTPPPAPDPDADGNVAPPPPPVGPGVDRARRPCCARRLPPTRSCPSTCQIPGRRRLHPLASRR